MSDEFEEELFLLLIMNHTLRITVFLCTEFFQSFCVGKRKGHKFDSLE